jgi:hypothetical protein
MALTPVPDTHRIQSLRIGQRAVMCRMLSRLLFVPLLFCAVVGYCTSALSPTAQTGTANEPKVGPGLKQPKVGPGLKQPKAGPKYTPPKNGQSQTPPDH